MTWRRDVTASLVQAPQRRSANHVRGDAAEGRQHHVGPTAARQDRPRHRRRPRWRNGGSGAEIVNADAYQMYRGMDILLAKPTADERAAVPHHLLINIDPDEALSGRQIPSLSSVSHHP